jgi:hypothetical protein
MIATYSDEMPWVTTEQMIEVDRAMTEDFRIDLMQMMRRLRSGPRPPARHPAPHGRARG